MPAAARRSAANQPPASLRIGAASPATSSATDCIDGAQTRNRVVPSGCGVAPNGSLWAKPAIVQSSARRISVASGGKVSSSEAGRPCEGTASARTSPPLPMFDPPYCAASVLTISRHAARWVTPMR